MERVFTQVAQTWPLVNDVKFENIEAAIQVLRQARDYLYRGLKHVGSVAEHKVSAEKMQEVASAMDEIVDRITLMQGQIVGNSKKTDAISAKIDQMSERISDAYRQMRAWRASVSTARSVHADVHRKVYGKNIDRAWTSMAETQADLQARDQRMDNMEEIVFNNAVTMERGLQECRDGLASLQIPDKGQMSAGVWSSTKSRPATTYMSSLQ